MLTRITRQMVTHPKTLEKICQELVERVSDLEAKVRPEKGAGKLRDKRHAEREAKAEGKRKIAEATAQEKADEERATAKAEAEEDALAAAEQKRQEQIKRSQNRAAAKNPPEDDGEAE